MADDDNNDDTGADDKSGGGGGNTSGGGGDKSQNRDRNGRSERGADRDDKNDGYSQEDVDRIVKDRLDRERKKYSDYDDLKAKAKKSDEDAKAKQTVEEQLEQLRKDMADRDAAATAEKAEIATDRLHSKLVRGGLSDDDASTLVGTIDAFRLLEEGKPNGSEIDRISKALLKIGTRQAPDRDQGRKGGDAPPSMNEIIRTAAKRTSVT